MTLQRTSDQHRRFARSARSVTIVLVVVLCIAALVRVVPHTSALQPAAAGSVPEFAIIAADGSYRVYSTYTEIARGVYSVSDSMLDATVRRSGNDIWRLELSAHVDINTVRFPWMSARQPLGDDISDDVYYYPIFLGIGQKAALQNEDGNFFGGTTYPGALSAPLVVVADGHSARIVAATNWPPKAVRPFYGAERMFLVYDRQPVMRGHSETFGALISEVRGGTPSAGVVPWQLAVDKYRAWLDSVSAPIAYPSWMWEGEGILNVQSEWQTGFTPFSDSILNDRWLPVQKRLPWVVIWGQMSGPSGDCCGIDAATHKYYPTLPQMDRRLVPSLVNWVKNEVVAKGFHAAYYSAPYMGEYGDGADRLLDSREGLAWFDRYNRANAAYGANSFYFDTLARHYWGEPDALLRLFRRGQLSREALAEGLVDYLPVPGLVSGALTNGGFCGAPYRTPLNIDRSPSAPAHSDYAEGRVSFPRLGRYLMGDRLAYGFYSNADWIFWGNGTWNADGCNYSNAERTGWCDLNGPCEHGSERLAFLLGTKLDVLDTGPNPVLEQLFQERERVHWWERRPKFIDTKGLDLTRIPFGSKVEAGRFIDANGRTLVAVSNPLAERGVSIGVDGRTIEAPPDYLHVFDLGESGTVRPRAGRGR